MFGILFHAVKKLNANIETNSLISSSGTIPTGPIGPPGMDGLDGLDGQQGLQGIPGTIGAQGLQGLLGAPGLNGEDGLDGLDGVPGAQGLTGAAGAVGTAGIPGMSGEDGLDADFPSLDNSTGNPAGWYDVIIKGSYKYAGIPIITGQPTLHNYYFGETVGNFIASGGSNIGVGFNLWSNLSSGHDNVAIGKSSSAALTIGLNNVAIGSSAMVATQDGSRNMVLGANALATNISGSDNVAIGSGALNVALTGSTIAIGSNALSSLSNGSINVAIGGSTLSSLVAGSLNIAIGDKTLKDLASAAGNNGNTVVGAQSGWGITTGIQNTILGANVQGLAAGLTGNIIIADGAANQRINVDATGRVGINLGVAGATAFFHLPAGAAAANKAPLKFTSGTNLTAAEAGAVEWDGTNLFVTQTTGPTRKTVAYTTNFPNIAASTFEKAETGTDANVLTYTSGGADEFLNVQVATDVSAITGTSIVVTVTWKDSNNATATSTLTLTAIGDGTINIPMNVKTATNVVVSTVFVGVSTAYNISAFITRLK